MNKRIDDLSNSKDIDGIMGLLMYEDEEDPAETEELGEESDIASQDEVEERRSDSESEQDGDELSSDEEDSDGDTEFYLARDKITKWNKKPPSKSRRVSSHNLLTHLPGVKGNAKNAKTAFECWSNLFTDEILEIIVKFTNQYIDTIKHKFARERDIRHTDLIELKAFIGLLYLAGAYKSNRQLLEELWGKEGDGIEKFGLVMNIKRFKLLLRVLRFDDRTTRNERKAFDRLAPIREVFDNFVGNCQNSYCLGENVTIDEMLPGFRGRCSFRQYIPSKPTKYGIKLFALVDSKMTYTFNVEIYAGKQPAGPFCMSNKPTDVVMRLAKPIFGSGRNITADNWFTDFNLVDELKTKKLSYVGTVRKNKRHLPYAFVDVKGRKPYSSLFGFNKGKVLTSYIPRKGKNVILVSSLHSDDAIDPGTGDKAKPELITFYNATKSGVDTADQMCATYSVHRNVKRWPMVVFFAMLNIGGINSQVIYLGNQLEPLRRRVFLKTLAHELTIGELQRRSQITSGLHTSMQVRLKRFLPVDDRKQSPTLPKKRSRCATCTVETGIRRLTNYACKKCNRGICLSHANTVCDACFFVCGCTPSTEPDSD